MTIAQKPVTAEELLKTPDGDQRTELVRGEVRSMAPAGNIHGRLAVKVAARLFQHVEDNNLGVVFAAETGFKIESDPDTVRAPDVAFVSRGRIEEVGEVEGFWPGAPDLAVEVVSPNDLYTEVEEKVSGWLEAGSRMVVVVNPRNKTVSVRRHQSEVRVLGEGDVLQGGEVVPGWELPVADVFR
ncbi:MAG: Uma2 family endonuclease [Rubrobacteraceae bacterium]